MAQVMTLGVLLALVGGWLLALGVLASKSGWSKLARQYRATGPVEGTRLERVSISVGRLYFRSKGIVVGNTEGVYLSLLPVFRPFHPPLFIPWKDLDRKGGHTDQVVFDVGMPAISEIRIPMSVVEKTRPN